MPVRDIIDFQNTPALLVSTHSHKFLVHIFNMPVVAVAGGTGSIGRTFVEELVNQGKHEVLVLS